MSNSEMRMRKRARQLTISLIHQPDNEAAKAELADLEAEIEKIDAARKHRLASQLNVD